MDPASAGGEPEAAAAEWPARAVGGMEYSWCRAVPGGTGTTLLAFRLARGGGGVVAAVQAVVDAHPVLRARLRGAASGSPTLAFPSAVPNAPPLPLALELLPVPESAPDFLSLLELELNRNPWTAASAASEPEPDAPPVLFATLYEPPPPAGGGSALFVRIHTAACDRAASASLVRELVALLASDGAAPAADPEDAAVHAALEERIPQRDSWKPFWARGLDMVGYSINGLRTSTLPFEVTGTERSTQMLRLGFDREETTRLLDACKQNGVKLCSAMAAATLLAARQSKQLKSDDQQETYSIAILINCRKFLEPALDDHNVGFFHSAITNTHTVHGGEGLWELAKRCQDSYASAKNSKKHLTDISDLNFLMCRAIENPQLTTATALRTAVVSVFEEPVVYELSDLQGKAGVEEFVCGATVHGVGPSIGLFDSIRDGQLELACMYPCPLHSRKQMQEIMNKVKQILHEGSIGDDENFEDCT
ncbi:uncharacterized protein LOC102701397 [Oryza brachyantha]|uniref:uncharacterized protein LOC102701397 n=1 Tax=Oryza brachyantha TaxID=4533 RepID=UPI001ADBDC66|nr:uncharacterized protein LOC102701397 [Oryza brachyantha]